jgi:DNA polymerase V
MASFMTNRGGKRENAGRKPGEPTKVVRIPLSQEGVVQDFLAALKRKQSLASLDNVVKILDLEQPVQTLALPLYTTKVAAGFPAAADDHVEQRLSPNDYLIQNDDSTFFVRVKGDSMIDAGIFDSDVLVVDRSRRSTIGDIVLAMVDGEFTVKTLGKSKDGPRLIPANKNFPVIEILDGMSFEVWGVVTGSMRRFI